MRRRLAFLLLALLVACGQQPAATHNQAVVVPAQNTAVPVDASQFWKPPVDASKADKNLILNWFRANDGCQGGTDVKIYVPICKKRDALQDRLRKHGWCWGAPMNKTAADDDWHRCGTYDTDKLSNADADVQRGLAFLGKGNEGHADATSDPHASDWYNEKYRAKSPLLQAYENAVEPIDTKIALANVLFECGIRGPEWHQQMLATLDDRKHQPFIEEMSQRLSPTDAEAADRFDHIVIDGQMKFDLGGPSKDAACRFISNAPFASNDRAFEQ